ncbi:hypothetical protein C2845_PM11G05030 [Panicum miliaceum]|uniref:Uncharacterized protein n=1 Tax=Panicum miliaceum TaxID=4540 RepID=A0A3L6RVN6_PANMI|nr:hypothetical protein C2845_PM11G05030 [Panicum miliaceum]
MASALPSPCRRAARVPRPRRAAPVPRARLPYFAPPLFRARASLLRAREAAPPRRRAVLVPHARCAPCCRRPARSASAPPPPLGVTAGPGCRMPPAGGRPMWQARSTVAGVVGRGKGAPTRTLASAAPACARASRARYGGAGVEHGRPAVGTGAGPCGGTEKLQGSEVEEDLVQELLREKQQRAQGRSSRAHRRRTAAASMAEQPWKRREGMRGRKRR